MRCFVVFFFFSQILSVQVHPNVESEPQLSAVGRVMAPGGLYSVNDEVEVLPRPRRNKKRKRLRRPREPLDDITVAGPSGSTDSGALASAPQAVTVRLVSENQMLCVTEMGSDDDQPLLA